MPRAMSPRRASSEWFRIVPAVNPMRRFRGRQRGQAMCKRTWIGTLGLWAVVTLGGCADFSGVDALRADVEKLRRQAAEDVTAWEDRLEEARGMGADVQTIATAEAGVTASRLRHAALDAAVTGTDAVLAEAAAPGDPIGQIVGLAAPWLPAPVRTPLVLGAAAGGALIRARQLKRGMVSVAVSLREASARDPDFARRFKDQADTLRSIQTPTARRIVDEADPTRRLVRLPV